MTTDTLDNLKFSPVQAFKFAAGDAGEVRGLGAVFGNVDSAGERILRGAFAKSIGKHQAAQRMPLLLWQHKTDEPVGKWTEMAEDDVGLRMVGKFNLATTRGRDAYEHVKAGDLNGLSIGYREIKTRPNGDVRELLELDLLEVSLVSLPANSRARITGVKAESRGDIERILREGGLPRAAAVKVANGGWPALTSDEPDPAINELLAAVKAARLDFKGL